MSSIRVLCIPKIVQYLPLAAAEVADDDAAADDVACISRVSLRSLLFSAILSPQNVHTPLPSASYNS